MSIYKEGNIANICDALDHSGFTYETTEDTVKLKGEDIFIKFPGCHVYQDGKYKGRGPATFMKLANEKGIKNGIYKF